MRTLFIRVAAVLFVTIFVGIDLIVYVAISSYLQQLVQQHIEATERVHSILVQELNEKPEAEWPAVIQRLEALLDYRIDIFEPSQASANKVPARGSNTTGELRDTVPIVEHTGLSLSKDNVTAMWPVPDGSGRTIRYARTYVAELFVQEDFLLFALLFVALPLVLYLTLRPIARKITDLSQVARAYATGKLDARSQLPAPRPLEQLADDIHQMARALQLKIQEQSVMTHAISHELKTPLTRMRMANDLALREADPAAWKQHLIELDDDLTMLEKIMAETLTLTRLTFQDQPLPMSALALHDVVLESLRQCTPGALDVEIDLSPSISVLANPDAIKRVFVNVLANAFRFARQRVSVSVEARNDEWVTMIEDDGPGVSAEDRDKVFMPFGRVESSRSRASGSTGMGLAIAATLVDKCKGSIWLDEGAMGGARFHIALTAGNPHH